MKIISRFLYVTADDLPVGAVASRALDALPGRRGYGGPVSGHWVRVRLTKANKQKMLAMTNRTP